MFSKIKKIFNGKQNISSNAQKWKNIKSKWLNILGQNEKNIEAWIQLISADINLLDFSSALKNIKIAKSLFPKNITLLLLESRAYMGEKNYKKAKESCKNIITLDPLNKEAYLQLSLISLKNEQYTESIEYAKKFPEDNMAILYMARAFTRAQDIDSAIRYWKKLLTLNEHKQEVAIQLSSIYINNNMFKESLEILLDASNEFPKNITLLNLKGKVYELLEEHDKSIKTYDNILELTNNKREDILIKVARIYLAQDNLERAQYYTNLALSINKDYLEAMVLDARIAKRMI